MIYEPSGISNSMKPFKLYRKYHLPAHLTESVTFRLPDYAKEILLGYSREKSCSLSQTIIRALSEYKPLNAFCEQQVDLNHENVASGNAKETNIPSFTPYFLK
jgi:hypothetical protein